MTWLVFRVFRSSRLSLVVGRPGQDRVHDRVGGRWEAQTGAFFCCKPGEYVESRYYGLVKSCQKCLIGYYCPNGRDFKKCDKRYYCNEPGLPVKNPCEIGYYCPDGENRIKCDPRKKQSCERTKLYEPQEAPSEGKKKKEKTLLYCPKSPKGMFCDSNQELQSCPPGILCNECNMNNDIVKSKKKHGCRAGFYCPGTESLFSDDEYGKQLKEECIHNFFCPTRSKMELECPPGFYCPKNSHEPKVCDPGRYCMGYGRIKQEKCGYGRYCPHPGMRDGFQCTEKCGKITTDGKGCVIDYNSIFPQIPIEISGDGIWDRMNRIIFYTQHIPDASQKFGQLLVEYLLGTLGILLVFAIGFIFVSLGIYILVSSQIPCLSILRSSTRDFAILLLIVGTVVLLLGYWWLGYFESKVQQESGGYPFDVSIDVENLKTDECFNLHIELKINPSRQMKGGTQQLRINEFGKNPFFKPKNILIRDTIDQGQDVFVSFVLESKSSDISVLGEKLLLSFNPIQKKSSCESPLYFVPRESLTHPENSFIKISVFQIVTEYFRKLSQEIKGIKLGVIGSMGVGKTTTISLFGSMLRGEVKIVGQISNLDTDNTNAVEYHREIGDGMVFVDTFGLKDNVEGSLFTKTMNKELTGLKKTGRTEKQDFVFLIMSVYTRMFHFGYLGDTFRRIRFYEIIIKYYEFIKERVLDPSDKDVDFDRIIEEIIEKITQSEPEFSKLSDERRNAQSMDATIFVTKSGVSEILRRQGSELQRHLNYKASKSHLFLFNKLENVCDSSSKNSESFTHPLDTFTGDVYLFRRKNEFETDRYTAKMLDRIMKRVGEKKGVLSFNWYRGMCNGLEKSSKMRKINWEFGERVLEEGISEEKKQIILFIILTCVIVAGLCLGFLCLFGEFYNVCKRATTPVIIQENGDEQEQEGEGEEGEGEESEEEEIGEEVEEKKNSLRVGVRRRQKKKSQKGTNGERSRIGNNKGRRKNNKGVKIKKKKK